MITTTLVFDRKKKSARNKKGTIEIRIILNRKSYYISTGVRVLPQKWADGFIVDCADAPELNARLRILLKRCNDIVNRYIEEAMAINMEEIKKQLFAAIAATSNGRTDMIDWIAEQIDKLNIASGTYKHYATLLRRLTEFGGLNRWSDLTTENIYLWDEWLHALPGARGEQFISDAGVYTYHKNLKALLMRAERFGKIQSNPYTLLRGQFKRGEKENVEYLTEEEMQAICDLNLRPGSELGKARDLFIFQMYTGLSFTDARAFNIYEYKQVDGRWVKNGTRIKTGVAYVSELLPPVVEMLERNDWEVPKLSNQAYNRVLKVIGEMAGIGIPLHSHLARHTFATMMLNNGAEIQNVARMLGHTNITQTQRYAKVLAKSVHKDFEKVADKLQK